MVSAHRIVEVGREWVGTRYHVGQSVKGQGADCCGFVLGVLAEAGIGDWRGVLVGRPRHVPQGFIRERCGQIGFEWSAGEWVAGEVLYSLIGVSEEHISIYAGEGRVLHASLRGVKSVAETEIALAGVVVARYRFEGVDYGVPELNTPLSNLSPSLGARQMPCISEEVSR